jgi:hypothetical protein
VRQKCKNFIEILSIFTRQEKTTNFFEFEYKCHVLQYFIIINQRQKLTRNYL